MGFLKSLFDKAGHDDVALHLDILADVKASGWSADAKLNRLGSLAWDCAANCPLVTNVKTHGSVAMSLDTEGQVVESAGVGDISRHDAARQVRDLVSERVPDAATLLGLSVSRRLNDVAFLD
jgi:hypothetical protein